MVASRVDRSLVSRCVIAAVLLTACNSQPQSPIHGRWKEVNSERTVEFKRNGSVYMSDEGAATYRLIDDNHLEVKGSALRTKIQFQVTADRLTLEPEGQATREYERIK